MPGAKTTSKRLAFSTPAYKRIEDDLRSRIRNGDWRAGHQIPGRRDLAKTYNVELNTLQRAILNLVEDGTLRTEAGRGTYVSGIPGLADDAPRALSPTTRTVGVIGSFDTRDDAGAFANTWNGVILRHMEQVFSEAEILPHYADMVNDGVPIRTLLETVALLRSEGAEAIAVAGFAATDTNLAAWEALTSFPGVPMVFVSSSAAIKYPINQVYYDSATAGHQAGLHLARQGCRSVGFFAPFTVDWVEQRCSGSEDALLRSPGSPDFRRIISERDFNEITQQPPSGDLRVHEELAYEDAIAFLSSNDCPEGIVACNDWVAFGFMRAASECGLTAGEDYAIIGFDDHPRARAQGLSSMAPPLETLGREAARMLIAAMTDQVSTGSLCLHSRLMQRKSSGLPRTRS